MFAFKFTMLLRLLFVLCYVFTYTHAVNFVASFVVLVDINCFHLQL